jgi:hypothetical protein
VTILVVAAWLSAVLVYVTGWALLLGHLVHCWRTDRLRVSVRRQAAVSLWNW